MIKIRVSEALGIMPWRKKLIKFGPSKKGLVILFPIKLVEALNLDEYTYVEVDADIQKKEIYLKVVGREIGGEKEEIINGGETNE